MPRDSIQHLKTAMRHSNPNIELPTAIRTLIHESRYRPIIPFLGSGLSYAAGFPTIRGVIQYLAKVDFAIQFDVYKHRYPQFSQSDIYIEHPHLFVEDFGWPSIGELNADLWNWLDRCGYDIIAEKAKSKDHPDHQLLLDLYDVEQKLEFRDHLRAIVQWSLRRDLASRESGTQDSALRGWITWKDWYQKGMHAKEPWTLYGDWESLLDRLCEGNLDLVDSLFSSFEKGRRPTLAHRYLAFLFEKLGIPLAFTTNFDPFLERALSEEGIEHRVFDIHRDAALPHASLVRKQTSILKLHGSAYGLRVGERLKYPLKSDTRESMLEYIPEEALLLVTGVSGSERRMLQILKVLASEQSVGGRMPRMLWLEGPGERQPMLKQFIQEVGDAVQFARINDISTFLQQLFFHFAGGVQASQIRYSALPGRPVVTVVPTADDTTDEDSSNLTRAQKQKLKKKQTTRKADREKDRKPVQIFATKSDSAPVKSDSPRASSWAGLAVAKFVSERASDYNVIWIDLEKHHTVSGTVSEILQKARAYDPDAPHFTLNFGEISASADDEREEKNIQKAVERIHEVLRQSRCILVLDSVESYGRPQFQHHGVPSFELTTCKDADVQKLAGQDEEKFDKRLNEFRYFLEQLLAIDSGAEKKGEQRLLFWDSYICISVDCTQPRHGSSASRNDTLNDVIIEWLRLDRKESTHVHLHEQVQDGYGGLNIAGITKSPKPEIALSDEWKKLESLSDEKTKSDAAAKRFECILTLKWRLEEIQTKRLPNSGDDAKAGVGIVSLKSLVDEFVDDPQCRDAMIAIFSVFRRPRSVACIRSMTERWGVDSESHSSAVNIRLIRNAVDSLIWSKIVKSESDFGMLHEGGSVWLYREVHTTCYQAMTESLRRSDWILKVFRNPERKPKPSEDDLRWAARAIVDGVAALSFHIDASRVYYADTFMPTKDLEAFYEYLYHRCWAIRTASLLIRILSDEKLNKCFPYARDILVKTFEDIGRSDKEKRNGWCEVGKGTLDAALSKVGVFSSLKMTEEDSLSSNITTATKLTKSFKGLRRHCLLTLVGAFRRQEEFLRASATPDTLLGWIDQMETVVFPEINGKLFGEKIDPADKVLFKELEDMVDVLNRRVKSQLISEKEVATEDNNGVFNHGPEPRQSRIKRLDERRDHTEMVAKQSLDDACDLWRALDKDEQPWESNRKLEGKRGPRTEKIWDARKHAITYEVHIRESTRSEEEDARHRSCALALLARSEYLLGYFRQAYHRLDMASAGLTQSPMHSVSKAMIHSYRAELLTYSADDHYTQQLGQHPRDGLDWSKVHKELKKVNRANREARESLRLLSDAENLTKWRSLAHLGVAQVQLERLLFESEAVFVRRWAIAPREFSEKCGMFEGILLDGLRNLRASLDLLPYTAADWDAAKPVLEDSFEFKGECKIWSLWRQFYIAGSFIQGLLATYYRPMVMIGRSVPYDGDAEEILNQITCVTLEQSDDRWSLWNKSVRFENVAKAERPPSSARSEQVRTNKLYLPSLEISKDEIRAQGCCSLRKVQTLVMNSDLRERNEVNRKMWQHRRDLPIEKPEKSGDA